MLIEIPLRAIPNQQITFGTNNQTFNLVISTKTVNDKILLAQTPDIDINTRLYTFTSIFLGITPIIQTTISLHARYLIPYTSAINGYLFFYVEDADGSQTADDSVSYINFGTTTHLYYSDYDALALNYKSWVSNNQKTLALKYIYDVSN